MQTNASEDFAILVVSAEQISRTIVGKRHPRRQFRGDQKKWSQRERFAVAAIAYCLENDSDFRSHFLRTICDAPADELSKSFDILIEDKLWGDLVLMERNECTAYIVECKINAPLQTHQNPSAKEFWADGYGKAILDRFSDPKTRRGYVVLGYQEKLPEAKGSGIECSQKYWLDIEMPKPSPIIADLYNCLGNLGVRRFRSRLTSTMKRASSAQIACETYGVLRAAYDHLGLAEGKSSPEISYDADGNWWDFGLIIHTSRKEADSNSAHGRLQRAVNRTASQIGWFGYSQQDPQSGVCFSVWFYCNEDTQLTLHNQLQTAFGNNYVQVRSTEAEKYVEVRIPKAIAEESIRKGDQEWFVSVFEAAIKS